VALALAVHGAATARCRFSLEAARVAATAGDPAAALDHARRGRRARPDHPDPRAFLAQAILALPDAAPELRAEGEREAAAALRLEPGSAVLHWTQALYHQAAGERAAAWRERHAAHRLYPLKDLYRPPAGVAAPADDAGAARR
jgi:ectoine hydroxylase-related dioxygenase (phytanoyl-CoA dioxygenase family)